MSCIRPRRRKEWNLAAREVIRYRDVLYVGLGRVINQNCPLPLLNRLLLAHPINPGRYPAGSENRQIDLLHQLPADGNSGGIAIF
jgi:hypothetical protein